MAGVTRVLLVDDDALVRAGLRLMLGSAADIEVVAEADDGHRVHDLVRTHAPDVVLMDIRMPGLDGLEATRLVRAMPDPPRVLVLTTFTADSYVLRALRAGADGFLLKHTSPARIIEAVRRAAAGEPVMSPESLGQLIDRVTVGGPEPEPEPEPEAGAEAKEETEAEAKEETEASEEAEGEPSPPSSSTVDQLDALGAREREVALEVAKGRTNAQIAADLYMSVPTVKSHVSHILAKLDLDNRVQTALLVYRAGLL
ncbi:response regulator [Streptomyces sp. NPDC098789]|uniref:response regulator n=1 Tax=Streptomyces sp. NPDC098789 TaxID=3366098 RepID=UPI00382EC232